MTDHSPSKAMRATQAPVVQEAALIANFYGRRDELQSLLAHLIRSFALVPQGHNDYANESTGTLLRYKDPNTVSAHDTTIIQIALNTPGAAETAWQAMRKQLEAVLTSDTNLKHIWGYSLIYQTELGDDALSDTILTELLSVARRLYPEAAESPQPLAHSVLSGGQLWLIDIPTKGNGLQAATVYLALSQPNTDNRLVREVLYNPVAALLMVDLIAHKSYYQMRQYRLEELDEQYRQKMATLSTHTDVLLYDLTRLTVITSELDGLAREYGLLTSAVVHLDQLHVALQRQESNFDWWHQQADGGEVVEFHQRQIEDATKELELLVAEGEHPLQAANTAVDMMRAHLDKQQEGQQQRIETLLATVAAVFSVLVLIDKETAKGLLEFIGVAQPIGVLPELGVQVLCLVVFWLLTIFIIRLMRAKRPN